MQPLGPLTISVDSYHQDLNNIAPKRANWDLKRELDRKTAKLERKTQEAIHTLIRELDGLNKLSRFSNPC